MTLAVLRALDFDWVKSLDDVWSDDRLDVPLIQAEARKIFDLVLTRLQKGQKMTSPQGLVISGPGGSGKTHLLNAMRAEAWRKNAFFVLVDMSGVNDFWETVLLHMLKSLRSRRPDGRSQWAHLLRNTVRVFDYELRKEILNLFSKDTLLEALEQAAEIIVRELGRLFPDSVPPQYRDLIRAVIFLNSFDSGISDKGRQWLQGYDPDGDADSAYKYSAARRDARGTVAGLSWLIALGGGVTVLALDQLDGIVKKSAALDPASGDDEEGRTARRIINNICNGLLELKDNTSRNLTVVSCLRQTWDDLAGVGLKTFSDRYEAPIFLSPLDGSGQAARIIAGRISQACQSVGETVPYATWPFPLQVLEAAKLMYPRALLQNCDRHVKNCLLENRAREAESLIESGPAENPTSPGRPRAPTTPPEFDDLESLFQRLRLKVDVKSYKTKTQEDVLWPAALTAYLLSFSHEHRAALPSDADLLPDPDDRADRKFPLLHAKLRYESTERDGGERHLALRAMLHDNAIAFQNRLGAAMTQSGIDRRLPYRRLALIRFQDCPGGLKTKALVQKFNEHGGLWLAPDDEAIRSLAALAGLRQQVPPALWRDWVLQSRPASKIGFLSDQLAWLLASGQEAPPSAPAAAPPAAPGPALALGAAARPDIPVGRRLIGDRPGEILHLPLMALKKHVAIFGGSGSGKTVLTRRLVEEAALRGVPSIVIDLANDLARLGQPWPEAPGGWRAGDAALAHDYFARVEVKVWTPGREGGNPLRLRQIPAFDELAGDEDSLQQAVEMAIGALRDILGLKVGDMKTGLLASALRWMAVNGGGDLGVLAEVLADLPFEAGRGIHAKAAQQAADMAGKLKAAMISNPLMSGEKPSHDIAGLIESPGKTRISVINLSGLNDETAQRLFVGQLVMGLFSWVKSHPDPGLGGLLVIDEAKEFVPALKSAPSKEAIVRFASQARKYGFGLILAAQEPKSVDHKVMANCNSQFFGRLSSPAAISAANELLGGTGTVGQLKQGIFLLKAEALAGLGQEAVKMAAPLCLSHHPPVSPPLEEVLVIAKASRA
ncbi:MAG: DUF87 domain-containing protein [Candidatus Adiutrix sp.]|jgi:hypothetical protein|nr:DUF87 domain-containing protein [Candidatus Adiutrix sp.]